MPDSGTDPEGVDHKNCMTMYTHLQKMKLNVS